MPELEAMSAGNPERAAVTILGVAASFITLVLALAGEINPEGPAWSMIRALTWWLSRW